MAALNPLKRWQRRGITIVVATLVTSGWMWLFAHFALGNGEDGLPHPLEATTMKIHGAAVMAALFFVGGVVTLHVPRGWRLRQQRRSGVMMLTGVALLASTGYVLYYFAPDTLRTAIGLVHASIGTAFASLLLYHGRDR